MKKIAKEALFYTLCAFLFTIGMRWAYDLPMTASYELISFVICYVWMFVLLSTFNRFENKKRNKRETL